jgi:bZIP transcription factor
MDVALFVDITRKAYFKSKLVETKLVRKITMSSSDFTLQVSSHPSNSANSEAVAMAGLKRAPDSSASLSGMASDGDGSSSDNNNSKQKRLRMTHSKDGQQLSEKKLRRLEKNRLSARECRRRKREATENIQHQINSLEAQNLQLRLQLQIGQEAESCIASEQSKVTEDIHNLLKSGASEADIYATLEEFKEKYADYGKSRRSSIEFHLRQIERLLMPTQTTSVVMHAIQGGSSAASTANAVGESNSSNEASSTDEALSVLSGANAAELLTNTISPGSVSVASVLASDDSLNESGAITTVSESSQRLDPKALFQYLVQYLEVSPQQAAAMRDSRLVAQEMDGCLETALGVLSELRQRLAQTGEDLETEFYNIRSILTPTQAAKFLVWVANNDACMHMLNELWDRVYPQPDSLPTLDCD